MARQFVFSGRIVHDDTNGREYVFAAGIVNEEAAGGVEVPEPVPAGSLTLTSYAPSLLITGDVKESVPAGSLTITSYAPSLLITGDVKESVLAGSLTLTSYAPSISIVSQAAINEPIVAGALQITSFAPSIAIIGNVNKAIPVSNLYLTSYAPTTSTVGNIARAVPATTLRLVASNPGYSIPTGEAITRPTGGAKRKHRERKRRVMVNGKTYLVESKQEELWLLERLYKEEVQKTIEVQAEPVKPQRKRKLRLHAVRAARLETRIEQLQLKEAYPTWLREEDEEILALLAA